MIHLEDETEAGEIYLDSIAVSHLAQGKGIGKVLLTYVIDHYVVKGAHTLGLLVDEENPKAKSLYLKVGFEEVGKKKLFGKRMQHLQIGPQQPTRK